MLSFSFRRALLSLATCCLVILVSPTQGQTITRLDYCTTYSLVCADLLSKVNCPAALQQIAACETATLDSFVGTCVCGSFDLGSFRVAEDLVDYVVKAASPSLLRTTEGRLDVCTSYSNICSAFLTATSCPAAQQTAVACLGEQVSDPAISSFVGICQCGSFMVASSRIVELVSDSSLGNATAVAVATNLVPGGVNYCSVYADLCTDSLDNILRCPVANQTLSACTDGSDLASFVGTCSCGSWTVGGGRFQENILDYLIKAAVPSHSIKPDLAHFTSSAKAIDLCESQQNVCHDLVFANLTCPLAEQQSMCQLSGVSEYTATCTCGALSVADTRIMELLVDSLSSLP